MRFRRTLTISRFIAPFLTLLLCGACAADSDEPLALNIGPHTFEVEVASTPPQRERGLMGRTHLPASGGMLFVFELAARHCFWMRNTPLPLSIAFIDDSDRIVNLADMQPGTDSLHCPATNIRYALEVAQGTFQQRGIAPGALVIGLPE